jgi:hypothetical protein
MTWETACDTVSEKCRPFVEYKCKNIYTQKLEGNRKGPEYGQRLSVVGGLWIILVFILYSSIFFLLSIILPL